MSSAAGRLILASASPRRRELLAERGLDFTVEVGNADETISGREDPEDVARELASRKARVVGERLGEESAFVLGGDTLVVLEGPVYLEKPANAEEARAMLDQLSGTTHRVITGVAVWRGWKLWSDREVTWVTMRVLTESEKEAYVASGEWQDKAGGYGIQGEADQFVTELRGGGFDNVVGLPVDLALEVLERAGWLDPMAGRR